MTDETTFDPDALRKEFADYCTEVEPGIKAKAPRLNQLETLALIGMSVFQAAKELKAEKAEQAAQVASSEKHRNDMADKIVSQQTEIGALKSQIAALTAPVAPAVDALTLTDAEFCAIGNALQGTAFHGLADKLRALYASALSEGLRKDAVRREALEEGYALGFAASGEGWNGEYPARDLTIDPRWIKQRDEDIGRALSQSTSGSTE